MKSLINEDLQVVAEILPQSLLDQVIFVGGATIGLYIQDKNVMDVRPTLDVDLVLPVATKSKYYQFTENLKKFGFAQSLESNDPPYRMRYNKKSVSLIVDVLSHSEDVLGFSNKWYAKGSLAKKTIALPNGKKINLMSFPFIVATKILAFKNRGKNFYESPDLEDIITLFDGILDPTSELAGIDDELLDYLKMELKKLLDQPEFLQAIEGHISSRLQTVERKKTVLERMRSVVVYE